MKLFSAFMIVASAASLLACGKSEEAAAPPAQAPVAEATPAEPAPVATVEPAAPIEPAPAEVSPSVTTLPETKAVQPVAPGKPAAAQPVEAGATAPAASAPDLAHGQNTYRQACAFCHDRGVAGAPKTGDAAAWKMRMAQGMESLYTVAIRGKGAMPAKGGNPSLSETDVKAAVDYMVAQSR